MWENCTQKQGEKEKPTAICMYLLDLVVDYWVFLDLVIYKVTCLWSLVCQSSSNPYKYGHSFVPIQKLVMGKPFIKRFI
jgi:hypothetical protein